MREKKFLFWLFYCDLFYFHKLFFFFFFFVDYLSMAEPQIDEFDEIAKQVASDIFAQVEVWKKKYYILFLFFFFLHFLLLTF